jgi:N-acetylneuraminic acid mutarotase
VAGGSNSNPSTLVEAYEFSASPWEYRAPLPLIAHSAAVLKNGSANLDQLIVAGGRRRVSGPTDPAPNTSPTYSNEILLYSESANEWVQQAASPVPGARAYGGLVSVGLSPRVYWFGGRNASSHLNTTLAWNSSTHAVQTLQSLDIERRNFATAVRGNIIYLLGGQDANSNVTKTVRTYTYDGTAAAHWQTAADMPEARAGHGAAAIGGKLYVMG